MSRNREDKDIEKAKQRLAQSNAELERALSELRALKARERQLEEEVATIERNTAAIERDTAVLKKDTAVLKKDTAVLKKDTAVLKKDTAVLKRDTAEREKKTAVLEKQAAALEQNATTLQAGNTEGEARVARLEQELAESRKILAARKAELAARVAQNAELDSKIAASTAALERELAELAKERARAKVVDEEYVRMLENGLRMREEHTRMREEFIRGRQERTQETALLAQVLAQKLLDGATVSSINAQLSIMPTGTKIIEVAGGDTELIALILLIEAIKLGNEQAQRILADRFEGVDINDLSIPDANGDIDAVKTAQVNAIIAEFVAEFMPQPAAGTAAQYGPAAYAAGSSGLATQGRYFVGMCLINNSVPLDIHGMSERKGISPYSKLMQKDSAKTISYGDAYTNPKQYIDLGKVPSVVFPSFYADTVTIIKDAICNQVASSLQTLWSLFEFKEEAERISAAKHMPDIDKAVALVAIYVDLIGGSSVPMVPIGFGPSDPFGDPDNSNDGRGNGNGNDIATEDSGLAPNVTGAINGTDAYIV